MKMYERIENNNFEKIDKDRAIELIENGNGHLVYNQSYFDLQKENEELKEYIMLAPNLDEMTAIKYRNIQKEAYIRGRAEEQKKAEQMIYENYIPVQKVKDKIEELESYIQESSDEQGYWGSINADTIYAKIEVLQELLESE